MATPAKNAVRVGQMGIFAQASNHQVMSGWLNYPFFEDVTASPVQSPVALTTTPVLINTPGAAAEITIIGAVAFRVGDQAAINNTKPYVVWPANTPLTIPLVTPTTDPGDTTGQLWLAADSTSGAISFFFGCV